MDSILEAVNRVFVPYIVDSIAFLEHTHIPNSAIHTPVQELCLSNPCVVNVTLKEPSSGKKSSEFDDHNVLQREFWKAGYHKRLEMIGVSVQDLQLPVLKFTPLGVTVSSKDALDTSEFSTIIDLHDLLAVAFGKYPSSSYQTARIFYRAYPEVPTWWPDSIPYGVLILREMSVHQKESLYTALLKLFGLDTPVRWKQRRPKRKSRCTTKSRKSK